MSMLLVPCACSVPTWLAKYVCAREHTLKSKPSLSEQLGINEQ
jgi:hypothetical protein